MYKLISTCSFSFPLFSSLFHLIHEILRQVDKYRRARCGFRVCICVKPACGPADMEGCIYNSISFGRVGIPRCVRNQERRNMTLSARLWNCISFFFPTLSLFLHHSSLFFSYSGAICSKHLCDFPCIAFYLEMLLENFSNHFSAGLL